MNLLTVAKYDEDTSWTQFLPKNWEVSIIEKGVDLPNKGREASSYLFNIIKYYDTLQDIDKMAFVQGLPVVDTGRFRPNILNQTLHGFNILDGSSGAICTGLGEPLHPGLSVAENYERYLKKPFPGLVVFAACAQFIVTGELIKSFDKSFYLDLYDVTMEDALSPWWLERLWSSIFLSKPITRNRATEHCNNIDYDLGVLL